MFENVTPVTSIPYCHRRWSVPWTMHFSTPIQCNQTIFTKQSVCIRLFSWKWCEKHPIILMFWTSKLNSMKTWYTIKWELINLTFTELVMKLRYSKILLFFCRRYLLLPCGGCTQRIQFYFISNLERTSLLLLPNSGALTCAIVPIFVTASLGNLQCSEG